MLINTTADQLEAQYENWGRWCRERKIFGECDSLEGNYRSPQEWEPVIPAIPVTREDVASALDVNRAWLQMPFPYKLIFKDWYALRRKPQITCRKCHIRMDVHDEYLARAKAICSNLMALVGN